ncbi:MAG: response regulator [Sphingobium sp.]
MGFFSKSRRNATEAAESAPGPHATEQDEAPLAPRRIRLLIVDENATALSVMARRLSHMGYDVVLAENGFAALNLMLAHRFDLIIVDMEMEMLSGVETIRKMIASGLRGHASLLSINTHGDGPSVIAALDAGADDHMVKPFDFDVLDARIRHIVSRARQIHELSRYNEALDARIARRAVELGEARAELEDLRSDRSRLVASIQNLHDEIERMVAAS